MYILIVGALRIFLAHFVSQLLLKRKHHCSDRMVEVFTSPKSLSITAKVASSIPLVTEEQIYVTKFVITRADSLFSKRISVSSINKLTVTKFEKKMRMQVG